MRQIVLDTETTGLNAKLGDRVIEIACVEMINRRLTGKHFHCYLNPEREIDEGALKVHGITLEFLADNPFYTKRFAFYVGRRCRSATIKDIAKELDLDWHAVKELEMQYMRAQLAKAGTPGPKAIGIDEISIRKGHTYRIVVSDLIRHRPIWFGGVDRSEASMAMFYQWLGKQKKIGRAHV